jgi:Uma2 family endonuclease
LAGDFSGIFAMKACLCEVPPHLTEWRKRTGADMWDEMWEGVLHMPPVPNREHQDFQWALETWLRTFWARPGGNRVHHEINLASVGGWPNNYRIPDLLLLTPDRFAIDKNEYFEGPPAVVVEIRSPDDESYEKLSFYAKLGVPEAWIIDRDTRAPEIYVLVAGDYQKQSPGADGWIRSAATAIQLRGESGRKLAIQLAGNQTTRRLLPED